MKFGINNPAWLQAAGNFKSTMPFFYLTSREDGNTLSFGRTAFSAFDGNVEYSVNSTEETGWEKLTYESVIDLNAGDTVYFRNYTGVKFDGYFANIVNATKLFDAGGDLVGLFYPDRILPKNAFQYAFTNQDNIVSAKKLILEAESLSPGCFAGMFLECDNLEEAPTLSSRILVDECYERMFESCPKLSAITCLATDISARECTSLWVSGVSSIGTFTKSADMNDWPIGYNGIPDGWTVQ